MIQTRKDNGSLPFADVRRNHALEHASIHVLSRQFPQFRFLGRSDGNGFFLISNLPLKEISAGIQSALHRLQTGEAHLAVHPNCGTNMMTGAFLSALSAMLIFRPRREKQSWSDHLDLLPLAILTSTLSMLVARPLGGYIQKSFTTFPNLENTTIRSITANPFRSYNVYRVLTKHT